MAVRNAEELLKAFDNDAVAAKFARAFLQRMIVPSFGSLPKAEIELEIFSRLIEAGVIDPDRSIYAIARILTVTPARARSLVFQHQLRHVSEADTDRAVLTTLAKARYWKEGSSLAFGVESPLVRAALAAKMREKGVFADVSLSGEILKVSPEQFGEVIAELLPSDAANALAKSLRKKGVDEGAVRKRVKAYGKEIASDFIKDEAKEGLTELLHKIGELASEHGATAIDHLGDFSELVGLG